MNRRDQLVEQATDYALEHGLIGLSLRPMAEALDTSDRMLLYHFGSKDELIAAVLRCSNDRSVARVRAMRRPSSVRQAVLGLWREVNVPEMARCQRLYVEASALGLLGAEPYVSVLRDANGDWMAALRDHFVAAGLSPAQVERAVVLVDALFMGLQLDLQLEEPDKVDRAVRDLADSVARSAQGRA
jgi:AcrR family transcriptional regulator